MLDTMWLLRLDLGPLLEQQVLSTAQYSLQNLPEFYAPKAP